MVSNLGCLDRENSDNILYTIEGEAIVPLGSSMGMVVFMLLGIVLS